jgi:hypothetical protein
MRNLETCVKGYGKKKPVVGQFEALFYHLAG